MKSQFSLKVLCCAVSISSLMTFPNSASAARRAQSSAVEGHDCHGRGSKDIQFKNFKAPWYDAMAARLEGQPVQLENGQTVPGSSMDKLLSQVTKYAAKSGTGLKCNVGSDPEAAKKLLMTIVAATAYCEDEWQIKASMVEKGKIAGLHSDGLMSMTYLSDKDPKNGCLAKNQTDMQSANVNLMCAFAKMQRMGFEQSMRAYWRGHLNGPVLNAAVNRECASGFQDLGNTGSGTAQVAARSSRASR